MASQKLSVYTLEIRNDNAWNDVIENLCNQNTEDKHLIINEQSNIYIGGCYLHETIQNQTSYNSDTNQFEIIPAKKFNVAKFDIYLLNNTMMIWGNKSVSSLLLTALGIASNNSLVIGRKQPDFKNMIAKLTKQENVIFTRMKITDIVIDDGIVVTCNVNLKNQNNTIDLINRYIESISQIGLILGEDATAISITIYSTGSITVFKDRENIDDEVINIISYIVGGEI